jgi:hypothetical protein
MAAQWSGGTYRRMKLSAASTVRVTRFLPIL